MHPGSARVYHKEFYPPNQELKDDVGFFITSHLQITQESLVEFEEDREDLVKKRIHIYFSLAKELNGYIVQRLKKQKFVRLDASKDRDELFKDIEQNFL